MSLRTRDKRLGPLAGLHGIRSTVAIRIPSPSKRCGVHRRLSVSIVLTLPVSPQSAPTKNPKAATPAAAAATNPTATQQAKEAAQGGPLKVGDGVVCRSMADAGPRRSPRMEDDNKRYFLSLLCTEPSRLGLNLCISVSEVHILM
jgi:hypothetical protein